MQTGSLLIMHYTGNRDYMILIDFEKMANLPLSPHSPSFVYGETPVQTFNN